MSRRPLVSQSVQYQGSAPQSAQRTAVIRPLDQSFKNLFVPRVVESVNSKFELSVEASQYDENRFSFEFSSVGAQMLLSPEAFIDFSLTVTGKGALQDCMAQMPILRSVSTTRQDHSLAGSLAAGGFGNYIAFGEGDCFSSAIASIQTTCNSNSSTSAERDKWWRSAMRLWLSPECAQSTWEKCGGGHDSYDAKAVGCITPQTIFTVPADQLVGQADLNSAPSNLCYGLTAETALARRCQAFMERSTPNAGDQNGWSRTVQCRWPVTAGLFHPFSGKTGVFANSPLTSLPFGIANYSSGSCTILFRNFYTTLIRQLGRINVDGGDDLGANTHANNIVVALTDDKPVLRLTFARLNSYRKWPTELTYANWRTVVIRHDPMVAGKNGAYINFAGACDKNGLVVLPPIGRDSEVIGDAERYAQEIANTALAVQRVDFRDRFYWDLNFSSIALPSVPNLILIVAQKTTDMYSNTGSAAGAVRSTYPYGLTRLAVTAAAAADGADADVAHESQQRYWSRRRCQNAASNLAIVQLEIIVQNGQGTFRYLAENHPYQRSIDELYRATRRNAVAEYMKNSGQAAWTNRCCAIALSEDQFQYGLSSSSVQFPITLSIRARAENRCKFMCGSQIAARAASHFPMVHTCAVAADPVVVCCYMNGYQSISEQSSITSGYLISQASLSEALARNAEENQL